ncbi:putative reverse transcriptase domain-containing protein [Tanacetum coccineum]
MRVSFPVFDGDTLNPEEFIDWLVAVEEVFEFKKVPENKRVSLIATKLHGRASAWWQQLKLTRDRVGKPRFTSWRKMKKCMRANFIPHNYQRLMYQKLHNLKQGTKSVEDYTTEFYQLITRNDIQETDDKLVSHYIGGLRVQIMESVNMFDPMTLSDAYQRALASHFVPNQTRPGGGNIRPVSKGVGSSGLKCFNFGEHSHRLSECKKAGKRTLFAELEEWEDDGVADDDFEEALVFDDDQYKEEIVSGDVGVNLMVCTFVVDPESCDNLIAEEAVQKLRLKTKDHPKLYKLQWLKKGGELTVSKGVLITFSVGPTYKDSVRCDMVPMDVCHLLLGRPWEYDRNMTHNGRANTYSFLFGGVKITLMLNKPKELVNKPTGALLTLAQFQDELEIGDHVKAWDRKFCQAEFAHNHVVNRSAGFSPFQDFVEGLHEVHKVVHDNLVRANPKYKQDANQKRLQVDFDVGDFVWDVLTKDRFSVGEYNKLSAKKIGPLENVEKINSNAYHLKLPSHIQCSDVFNVKHLLPYHGDSSDDDLVGNSRTNCVYPGGMMQAQVLKNGPFCF